MKRARKIMKRGKGRKVRRKEMEGEEEGEGGEIE